MGAVNVLDAYYLTITLLVTIAYQFFFFAIAWSFKFDKVTDFAGGTNFVLLAILTLGLSHASNARNILASLFLIIWGARLSGFLLFRILKTGKDDRFDDKRDKLLPFLGFWTFQAIWVFTVSLPVTFLNSPRNLNGHPQPAFGTGKNAATDTIGLLLWVAGMVIESVADTQKFRFRSTNLDKAKFMDQGLWAWSRHPNYFGEIILHFGIWLVAIGPAVRGGVDGRAEAALYASVVGPLFLTVLLLFVSGLPLNERPSAKKRWQHGEGWEAYAEYLRSTSILVPMPKSVWRRLPLVVKRTVGFEFPMYVFVPERDGGEQEQA